MNYLGSDINSLFCLQITIILINQKAIISILANYGIILKERIFTSI